MAKSKRPVVDINDATELVQKVMDLSVIAEAFVRDANTLVGRALAMFDMARDAKAELYKLTEKLQAATPPAPKSAYNKYERAILEEVPVAKGGWKRKKPTRAKREKPTVRKH